MDYTKHRLYDEYIALLNDDEDFAEIWEDSEEDFLQWVMAYENDEDWN